MSAIRRLYFYLVSFISLEVILQGLIGLLRSIFSNSIGAGDDALAQTLALIFVGVPIFVLHWVWAQRASQADEEEHDSSIRAIFLYGVLLATLIPMVQNTLAIVNRGFLFIFNVDAFRAILGSQQTWLDNIIAIIINGIAAAYFVNILQKDWKTLLDAENFADIRRVYRHLWLFYSLLMTIFGVQQVLRFTLYIPSNMLGQMNRDLFVNGFSLLVIGAPIWYFSWKACQTALFQKSERYSLLRLGSLFLLTLGGIAVVLIAGGNFLYIFLRWGLGETIPASMFISLSGGAISVGLPLGIVWAYYEKWLIHDIDTFSEEARRHSFRRLYYYTLSFAGLVASFVGMALVVSFIIDISAGRELWGPNLRSLISAALSTLAVGLPLWMFTWPQMQARALSSSASGGFARRSMVRRTYLYLVLFGSVIGGMVSAVTAVYRLLQALLGAETLDITGLLDALQLLVLFSIVLVYHLRCLRADGGETARALVERREKFRVLAFERAGSGFGDTVRLSTQKHTPGLNLIVLPFDGEISKEDASARAVILPSDAAVNPPENLRNFLSAFEGHVIVLPVEHERFFWAAGSRPVESAALTLRQLSEGQEPRQASIGASLWMIVVYIFAALFGLEVLLFLLSIGISLIAD